MRRLSLFLVFALLAGVLAGCVDDEPKPNDVVDPGPADDDGAGNTTLPYGVDPNTANDTELEGAHLHDEWGDATELLLADMTVGTADCSENPLMEVFLIGSGAFRDQSVQKGCAMFGLDADRLVPEGTAELTVEIDATNALQEGGMQLYYGNDEKRTTELEATTDPVFTWTIEMTPLEWDLPHSGETAWYFFLRPSGQIAILDGTMEVQIIAERLEVWSPVLGSAHVDHWAADAAHDFIAADVMRSLDTNVTVEYVSFADRVTGAEGSEPVPLDDIVAPGTAQVTLAVQWDPVQGCPPGHGCWVVAYMQSSGGGRGFGWGDPVESGADWAIYVYDVPEPLAPDSTYATASTHRVNAFVRACPNGEVQETPVPFFNGCMGEAVSSMSSDVRFEVESWKNGARVDELKTRLGFS